MEEGEIDNGWLRAATRRPSPNCDERPIRCDIDLLVIHNISLPPGDFGGPWVDDLFLNRLDTAVHPYFRNLVGLRVSTHLLIPRNGSLVQYVPLNLRAWHAGESCFRGREACNDFSIGIELEGTDDTPYTSAQYETLTRATHIIRQAYPGITAGHIAGHCDIAPDRKTDPGPAFDWVRYRASLD
ncbi:MAG: 1,6-anhydro-N-acetylmuramyl-L-alanine amidase AmpD [Pseudomonadota bacterium]